MPETETILHSTSIESLAQLGLLGPGKPVEHRHSLAPARVRLPALDAGRHFLEHWQLRELPDQGMWRQPFYDSYAPPLFVLHDVLVHSSAGIVAVGGHVIAETLAHTAPATHAYRSLARGIALPAGRARRLAGTHVSALAAGETSYYEATLAGLARLAAVPDNYQAAAGSLLVPQGAAGQRETLKLLDLMPSLSVREVGRDETLLVETLVLPLSVCGDSAYHPCVADFFRGVSANVPPAGRRFPSRIYIDGRGAKIRPLGNEDELVAALGKLGFVAVRPETLGIADQVRLFRDAEAIVSPHGTALTNIGYARPGCIVLELLMDAYVNWCFRHLAAVMGVRYDCVLGRARRPWRELDPSFHLTPWEISVNHVVAAVARTVPQLAAAA